MRWWRFIDLLLRLSPAAVLLSSGCGQSGTAAASAGAGDGGANRAACRALETPTSGRSSWPPGQPASLSDLQYSASGQLLYGIGTWMAGGTRSALVRSQDHGRSWCAVDTPSPALAVSVA